MLNIVTNNERTRTGSSILGYIAEVLHREYINVTTGELEAATPTTPHQQQSSQQGQQPAVVNEAPFTLSLTNTSTPNPHLVSHVPVTTTTTTNTTTSNTGSTQPLVQLCQQPTAQTINSIHRHGSSTGLVAGNKPPQVIKLQPFVSSTGHHQTTSPSVSAASTPNKVIYMSHQSPVKASTVATTGTNKLIKIGNMMPHQVIPASTSGQHHSTELVMADLNAFPNHSHTQPAVMTIQQQPQQQHQHTTSQSGQQGHGQSQQVLNLVLVTDGINGGVSYLSLVPQH